MVAKIEHQFINNIEHKWCGKCKQFIDIENYGNSKSTWDKLRPTCKKCLHALNVSNKENRTEYNKKYWEITKETQSEKSKQWRESNKERIKENNKKWIGNNLERKKQKDKEYRIKNWEKRKANHANWRRDQYAKMKSCPDQHDKFFQYKIKTNISRRIREMLRQEKSDRAIKYLGCTIEKLRAILESKFQDGMSWRNYGQNIEGGFTRTWHIDHIFPCCAFDMSNVVQVKACFHYKNLQPLWWDDNILKGGSHDKINFTHYMQRFSEIYIA